MTKGRAMTDAINPLPPLGSGDTPAEARRRAKHEKQRARSAAQIRANSAAAREIGALPAVADAGRRAACRWSLKNFCETYLAKTFTLAWSDDQLRIIDKIQTVTIEGGMHAHAMSRGSGKTSICEGSVLWALLYAHRDFVAVIGPGLDHSKQRIENLRTELENNDLLLADFPEVCYPIRRLEGIGQRRLTYQGRRIALEFSTDCIAFANLNNDRFAGGRVRATSLTGQVRGMVIKREDGSSLRPSLVLLDDPQKDEEARSPHQVEKLLRIINGAVLGLAGPNETISALMPCTVVCKDDLADQLTDPIKNPQWRGERTKMVYAFPTDEALWAEYRKIDPANAAARNGFYVRNKKALDAGAKVAWAARHPGAVSAIQYAMNLRFDLGERAFAAEYQNDPLPEYAFDGDQLRPALLLGRLTGVARGVVPLDASRLTAFIDVQAKALYYAVAAWGEEFSGSIIDYGTYPEQGLPHFVHRDIKRSLAHAAPGAGLEGSIRAGLVVLIAALLGREWRNADGTALRVGRCLIDANWGKSTAVVYEVCRTSEYAASLLPSHGKYVGPESLPFSEYRRRPGERAGLNWRVGIGEAKRQRRAIYDTNFWKTFTRDRLQTALGDPGALAFYGLPGRTDHAMIVEQCCAEFSTPTVGRGRRVDVWEIKQEGTDNHFFDCVVGAAVAASIEGAAVAGMAAASAAPPRRSFAAMQRAAREGR